MANSLAIITDAAHLLSDFASFLISLLAIWFATRPSTSKLSYGWHRAGKCVNGEDTTGNNPKSICQFYHLSLTPYGEKIVLL